MRALMVLLALGLAVFCFCDSNSDSTYSASSNSTEDYSSSPSSSESHSKEAIKVRRNIANALVKKRPKRAYDYYERYYEHFKSPTEMKKEQCEDYWPCEYLSRLVGFYDAYRLYFGSV